MYPYEVNELSKDLHPNLYFKYIKQKFKNKKYFNQAHRCAPPQFKQSKIPRLIDAHSGLSALQSQQFSLPGIDRT